MKENKLKLSIILRIGLSLIPILFNMPLPAMLWCSFNIAMSFIAFGPVTSIVASLCAILFSMMFFGIFGEGAKVYGVFLAIESILCAYSAIYTIIRRKEFFSGVWLCAAGYLIPAVMGLRMQAAKAGATIAEFLIGDIIGSVRIQFEQTVRESAISVDGEFINKLMNVMEQAMVAVIPSMLVIASVVVGYVVMWCITARLRAIPGSVMHSFSKIIIPRAMIILAIPTIILYFAGLGDIVSSVTLNLFIIVMYLCCFSGLSLVDFLLRKAIKITPVRIIVYIGAFVFLSTVVVLLLTLMGIVDSFCDFRKLRKEACK